MIDPSDAELSAMRTCLRAFGQVAGEIGFTKPLGNYTEAEALRVVDAIVTCFTEAMAEHHEATVRPPARGQVGSGQVRDPFADMPDDPPWSTPGDMPGEVRS